jgi:hypothetical protein
VRSVSSPGDLVLWLFLPLTRHKTKKKKEKNDLSAEAAVVLRRFSGSDDTADQHEEAGQDSS